MFRFTINLPDDYREPVMARCGRLDRRLADYGKQLVRADLVAAGLLDAPDYLAMQAMATAHLQGQPGRAAGRLSRAKRRKAAKS